MEINPIKRNWERNNVLIDTMNLDALYSPQNSVPWSEALEFDSGAIYTVSSVSKIPSVNRTHRTYMPLNFAFLWFIKLICYQILTSQIQNFRYLLPKEFTWIPICPAFPLQDTSAQYPLFTGKLYSSGIW